MLLVTLVVESIEPQDEEKNCGRIDGLPLSNFGMRVQAPHYFNSIHPD